MDNFLRGRITNGDDILRTSPNEVLCPDSVRSHVRVSRRALKFTLLSLVTLMTVACTNGEEPARLALDQIRNVLDRTSVDARKYLPEKLLFVQDEAATLSVSFDQKNYSAVIAGAPVVLSDANTLVTAVVAKRREAVAELVRQWSILDASLPPLVAAVRVRIDKLNKTQRRRKGVDLSRAQASIAAGDALWDEAECAFDSGRIEDAIALLKDAKPKAEEAAAALQLTFPGTE